MSSLDETRAYYDEFSKHYEDHRRPNDPHGYHALLDDLEIELVERYGAGKDVLECGCGTGLILDRVKEFARRAAGIDLSPGMLEHAKERGLDVREGSVTALPFEDASFDVTCSFKVLAHVPDINDFVAGFAMLLAEDGTVTVEFPHLLELVGNHQFDTVYHEHFSYLSLHTVRRILATHGFRIWDVESLSTHGGSLRVWACHAGAGHPDSPRVAAMLDREEAP